MCTRALYAPAESLQQLPGAGDHEYRPLGILLRFDALILMTNTFSCAFSFQILVVGIFVPYF